MTSTMRALVEGARWQGLITRRTVPMTWLSIGLCWICLAGCAPAMEAPSAYSDERFLCGEPAEFEALVADCRNADRRDRSCVAVLNLKAEIGSHRAVLGSNDLLESSYDHDVRDPAQRDLSISGISPYFVFRLNLSLTTDNLANGGVVEESGETCRTSTFGATRLSVEVRGASESLQIRFNTCEVRAEEGIRMEFSGVFARGGTCEGCLYLPSTAVVP